MSGMSDKTKKTIITVISVIMILTMSLMIVGNAWYTIYANDDFEHALLTGAFHVGFFDYLKASFAYARDMYMDWQGTYFSMFIQALLSPLNNGGLPQLRIVMVFNAILFLTSFLFFMNTLIIYLKKDVQIHIRLLIFALVFIQLFSSLEYPEIFTWFSGSTSYSFPLSFLFISVSLALMAEEKEKKGLLIASILTGYLGMGGVLGITGMGCSFMLLLVVVPLLFEKKLKKRLSIVFCTYFVFALFATLAPGNFRRRANVSAAFSPIKAFFLTAKKYFYGAESLFKDTGFIVIFLIFVVLGIIIGKAIAEKDYKRYACASVLAFLVPFITLFPIILGYGGYTYFPNRCYFLMNITLTLVFVNLAFLLGFLINRYVGSAENAKAVVCVIASLAVVCFLVNGNRAEENLAIIQINNLANGSVKRYYNDCNNLLEEIKNSPEEDVVVERLPDAVPHYADFFLSQDEQYWVNVDVAIISNKKSVKVISLE